MGVTMSQDPHHDEGTGEHSQATEPQTHQADDVTNKPTGEAEPYGDTATFEADSVKVESTGEHDTTGPVTTVADWPAPAGEDKAISKGEAKAAPAKKKAS